jgi:hypothetical protein
MAFLGVLLQGARGVQKHQNNQKNRLDSSQKMWLKKDRANSKTIEGEKNGGKKRH